MYWSLYAFWICTLGAAFCLRLKAKDLGITQVVIVGFFVSKVTQPLSLSLYSYYFFNICIFSFFLLFSFTISIYHSIIYVYLPSPNHLCLPTYVYLPMSTYLHQHTYWPMPTYLCLHTYINIPTYLSQTYLPLTTYQHIPTYLPLPTYLPSNINTPTYLPMSSYQHIPTRVNLPLSTYLPLPIPKHQDIIAADPGVGIGLV